MLQHQTASLKTQKRKAEESGGQPFGLAPFYAFIQNFNRSLHHRTRAIFHKRAPQYLSGLISASDRRNLEKISERLPDTEYQALHHFITHSPWDERVLCQDMARVANGLLGGRHDSCLLIDPTAIPKKGTASVGVRRQYCGTRGKIDNCQVGVFSALANQCDAVLINKRLYLPKQWCADPVRCERAGVPVEARDYKTNQSLALELIEDADRHGVDYAWVGLDAEFGTPNFLLTLAQQGKQFMVDTRSNTHVHLHNPRLSFSPKHLKTDGLKLKHKSVQVSTLPKAGRWKTILIRHSTKGELIAQYRTFKVWLWNGQKHVKPIQAQLIIRRTNGQGKGKRYKYTLCNAPEGTPIQRLAYQQSQRFWIEQAIKDCKDGLGMDEYQVRQWRGWHHHVALTMLAGLFLLKLKLENRQTMPLLSCTDLKELLATIIPQQTSRLEVVWTLILNRHRRRETAIHCRYRQQGARPPDKTLSLDLKQTVYLTM